LSLSAPFAWMTEKNVIKKILQCKHGSSCPANGTIEEQSKSSLCEYDCGEFYIFEAFFL